MKKSYKIIISIIIAFMLFSTIYNTYAADIFNGAQNFLESGSDDRVNESTESLDDTVDLFKDKGVNIKAGFEELAGFLYGIGLLAIVITTAVLGIRYMFVSPQEKSKIKEMTMPLIVGVIVIFGALTIWKFVINVLDGTILGS